MYYVYDISNVKQVALDERLRPEGRAGDGVAHRLAPLHVHAELLLSLLLLSITNIIIIIIIVIIITNYCYYHY